MKLGAKRWAAATTRARCVSTSAHWPWLLGSLRPRHPTTPRSDARGGSACAVGDGSRSHDRVRSVSVSSGQDADAVEAVDFDDLVHANEVEVLAGPGLPSLGASDAEHLDVASLADDVIAGSNVPGEGHLGLLNSRAALRHHHSLLSRSSALQSWAELSHPGS